MVFFIELLIKKYLKLVTNCGSTQTSHVHIGGLRKYLSVCIYISTDMPNQQGTEEGRDENLVPFIGKDFFFFALLPLQFISVIAMNFNNLFPNLSSSYSVSFNATSFVL